MTFDLNSIAPGAKAEAVALGRRYNSKHTFAQAELTLKGYGEYGAQLADHGYGAADAAELGALKDALYALGITREETRYGKKVDDAAYLSAVRNGKAVRHRSRTVLGNTRELLENGGTGLGLEKAALIGAALAQTSVAPRDAAKLAGQLAILVPLLKDTLIADMAKDRGGAKALGDLELWSGKLLLISQTEAAPLGTPAETEALDLLDGLIVRNCRRARDAARSASAELGVEAIQKIFELSALPKGGGGGEGGEGAGGSGGAEGAGGAAPPA